MKKTVLGSLFVSGLIGTGNAMAGGLWLNEFGDFSGGRAAAGAAAGLDDAAGIIYNAASASRIEGNQLFLAGGVLIPTLEFDIDYTNPLTGSNNGGEAALNAPGLAVAYVHDIDSDQWSIGISLGGLSGAGLEYNKQWVGRFQATDVELLVMALAPTASYQVTDKLALGASIQLYYSSLDLKLAVPSPQNPGTGKAELDGTDTGFGFTLGAIYEISDSTRLGMNYQSELDIDFDGKLKVNVADVRVDANTELTLAQFIRLSLHHDFNDRWGLAVTLGWDDWSAMDNVFVSVPERDGELEKNWDDTYHSAIGLEYQLNDKWQLTTGIAYDTNPVDASDRTADMPVDRQVRYAAGARYVMSDTMTVGGYINYVDLGSAKIRTDSWGGEFKDNDLLQISVFLDWEI
jgi:long-chain fatty acid transport protein